MLASCYTSVDHDLAHIAMTPMQWFPKIAKAIFGEDDGYAFVRVTKELYKSVMPNGQIFQY